MLRSRRRWRRSGWMGDCRTLWKIRKLGAWRSEGGRASGNRSAHIRLGEAVAAMRAGRDKSEGDVGELFGQTGLAARAPHSRLKHMSYAAESSGDMLFEGLSLHEFAERHELQSYVVSGRYTLL